MFQSTYDTAYNIGHMYPLYICKISWIFETGNIARWYAWRSILEQKKYFKVKCL